MQSYTQVCTGVCSLAPPAQPDAPRFIPAAPASAAPSARAGSCVAWQASRLLLVLRPRRHHQQVPLERVAGMRWQAVLVALAPAAVGRRWERELPRQVAPHPDRQTAH